MEEVFARHHYQLVLLFLEWHCLRRVIVVCTRFRQRRAEPVGVQRRLRRQRLAAIAFLLEAVHARRAFAIPGLTHLRQVFPAEPVQLLNGLFTGRWGCSRASRLLHELGDDIVQTLLAPHIVACPSLSASKQIHEHVCGTLTHPSKQVSEQVPE